MKSKGFISIIVELDLVLGHGGRCQGPGELQAPVSRKRVCPLASYGNPPFSTNEPRPKAQDPKLHHVAISRAAPTERQAGETSGVNDPDSV